MEITLILEGYLKNKYPSSIIELNYPKPVTIREVLKDAKVSPADVFFIKVEDSMIKEDYLLARSSKIKLFPIIGGGQKK